MKTLRLLPALLTAVTLVACGVEPKPPGEVAASTKQRITDRAAAADLTAAVSGNTAFAADIYKALKAEPGNVVFSPHSISTALAMTYAGAKADTARAFETTLHLGLPADRFHRAMNTLDRDLQSRGRGAQGKDGKPFRLNVANQLFGQKGFAFVPEFLDLLATEYGAGMRLMEFAKFAEEARVAINKWVEAETEGLIPELLGQGSVGPLTRLVLVNTVYFNAAWAKKFDPNATHPGDFTLLDGSTKRVAMMGEASISGARAVVGTTDVIELPYDGQEVSMVLLVPQKGSFAAFEQALTGAELERHVAAVQSSTFGVRMPKFDFKKKANLAEVLKGLGLGVAFSDQADFTGMTTTEKVAITGVLHEAVIKTDEAGTEAAAATAVVVGTTSVPSYIEVDRPFVFLIRDRATNAVVFLGRVVDP